MGFILALVKVVELIIDVLTIFFLLWSTSLWLWQHGFDEGVAGHLTLRDPILTDHFW